MSTVRFPVVGSRAGDFTDDCYGRVSCESGVQRNTLTSNVPFMTEYVWDAKRAAIGSNEVAITMYDPMHTSVNGNSFQAAVVCACLGLTLDHPITGGVKRQNGVIYLTAVGEIPEKLASLPGKLYIPFENMADVPGNLRKKAIPLHTINELL